MFFKGHPDKPGKVMKSHKLALTVYRLFPYERYSLSTSAHSWPDFMNSGFGLKGTKSFFSA
ncbi:MAG: hypothetical protein EA341_17615 [Mongoliibacter sp.]|nr:MAG: hypothetical protein EA341_17615 [Mongoliibacter sp.]